MDLKKNGENRLFLNVHRNTLNMKSGNSRTGIAKEDSYTFVLKELLDNAVDAIEKSNNPLVEVDISIRNNLLYVAVHWGSGVYRVGR